MKNKIKARVTGWIVIVLVIITGAICSCEPVEIKPYLDGVYYSDGIELVFNNGILTGQTECNSLNGNYSIIGNQIEINLKGTKVYCINEYNYVYFRDVCKYQIKGKELILQGNDFEIIMYSIN